MLEPIPVDLVHFGVIAGLDPGLTRQSICFAKTLTKGMDPRVKPAGDRRIFQDLSQIDGKSL